MMTPDQIAQYYQWLNAGATGSPPSFVTDPNNAGGQAPNAQQAIQAVTASGLGSYYNTGGLGSPYMQSNPFASQSIMGVPPLSVAPEGYGSTPGGGVDVNPGDPQIGRGPSSPLNWFTPNTQGLGLGFANGTTATTGPNNTLIPTTAPGTPGAGVTVPSAIPGVGGGGINASGGFPANRDLYSEGANTLNAQIGLAGPAYQAYSQYAPLYAQTDLNTLRNSLFGSVDAGQFLAAHPEFQSGYDNAGGLNGGQQWLDQAVNSSTYLDQTNVPRGGGVLGINNVLTQNANNQTVLGNTAIRQGNLNDIGSMGTQAQNLFNSFNPRMQGALDQANTTATNGIGVSPFQAQLGRSFNAGPSYQSVGGYNISPDIVSAGAIGSYPSVTSNRDPLLGAAQYQAATNGNTPLGDQLQQMASQQLSLGSHLSDQQANDASQAAREAWGARGLAMSPGAVGAEILNRDQYGQQLLQQRQGFASQVNQLGQSQQGLNNQYTLGVLGAGQGANAQSLQAQMANQATGLQAQQSNLGAYQQAALANQQARFNAQTATAGYGQQAQLANQSAYQQAQGQNNQLGLNLAGLDYGQQQQNFSNQVSNANLQSGNQFNPFQTITGWGTSNQGTNTSLYGMGAANTSGATGNQSVQNMFNPFNSYSGDLYNTNYNAGASQSIAKGNQSAATTGSIIGAVGTVAAAKVMFMCVPEGERIDTPVGSCRIEALRAGDAVIGHSGAIVRVLMKHEYMENPQANRFFRFTLDNGRSFAICDKHRVEGNRAETKTEGDTLGEGNTITSIHRFGGVRRSYDLLTEDAGYRMAGIPVDSMIEEMAAHAAKHA